MKRLCILIGVLAIVGVGLVFVLTRSTPEPLTYQGKSIEHWFMELPVAVIPPPGIRLGNDVRSIITAYGQQ